MASVCGHGAVFDWAQIRAELDKSDWEEDPDEPSQEMRTVWLGTIFGITPSGKFYAPFACSNVAGDCPACSGEGSIKPRTGKRKRARAKRRLHDFSRGVVSRGFMGTPAANAYADRVRAFRQRAARMTDTTCKACDGTGSLSAARDERWNNDLEEKARAIGAFVWHYDESIFVAECREAEETEDEAADA